MSVHAHPLVSSSALEYVTLFGITALLTTYSIEEMTFDQLALVSGNALAPRHRPCRPLTHAAAAAMQVTEPACLQAKKLVVSQVNCEAATAGAN